MEKTALLCRYGGIGDCLLLTVVAAALKRRGYEVDYVVGNPVSNISELFTNLNLFRNVFPATRLLNISSDEFIEDSNGNMINSNMIKMNYTLPIDYKHSVENNTNYNGVSSIKPEWGWFRHQNSNYQNWYDLSLGWANIDPADVLDKDKRPIYKVEDSELEWAKSVIPKGSPILGMQLKASSLVRTWYRSDELPKLLVDNYPDSVVVFFRDNSWYIRKGNTISKIDFPSGKNTVRMSAALISLFDVFISVDSGMAHIAEAVKTKSIVIYLTVPAWTRNKYYDYTYSIEPNVDCYPCFGLSRYCWRILGEVYDQLSDREKKLKKAMEANVAIEEIAKELNTNTEGIYREFRALREKEEGLKCKQPYCSASINNDIIMGRVKYILQHNRS